MKELTNEQKNDRTPKHSQCIPLFGSTVSLVLSSLLTTDPLHTQATIVDRNQTLHRLFWYRVANLFVELWLKFMFI